MATKLRLHAPINRSPIVSEAAVAYDAVGADYQSYADGEHSHLFDFAGAFAFADREIWTRLETELVRMRTQGRRAIRILDAGCGPGTWLLRLAVRARDLGFTAIDCRGFDVSGEMIELARQRASLINDPHMGIIFDVGDISNALDDEDYGSYDLVLCLYGVLNHLSRDARVRAAAELARVVEGDIFASVRAIGSTPSIFVGSIAKARDFHQDNERDRLEIDLSDGRHIGFSSHLFAASELEALFADGLQTVELVGLDLFHSRFAPDRRWNPGSISNEAIADRLQQLEHLCAHDPALLDRADHVLLHTRSIRATVVTPHEVAL